MANMTGLLAGFMKGMGEKATFERQQAIQKPQTDLQHALLKLQLQKEKTTLEETKMKQQLMNTLLQRLAEQGQSGGAAPAQDPSFNGQVEQAQKGPGVADKLASMDPMMLALMKQVTGLDTLGAGRLSTQREGNQRLTRQGDERIAISKEGLAETKRANTRRESEVTWMDIQEPGGGSRKVALPKFGTQGVSVQTKQRKGALAIDEGNLPLWVHPDTLETPPQGTTPQDAVKKGFKRLSTTQKDAIMSMGAVEKILGEVGGLMEKIFPKTETLIGRVGGAAKRKVGAVTQMSTEAAKFEGLIKGTLAPVIRSLGEKGALSDGDVKRAINLFPVLTDDADVAWGKLKQIQNLFQQIKDQHLSVGKPDFVFNPQTGKLEPSK